MILYLVRHGQSTNNAEQSRVIDPLLTPLGEEQARLVAETLRDTGLTVLHASPMRRALATAAAIGEAVGLPIRVAPEFCESGGLGAHPGLTRAEIASLYSGCELAESITEAGWWQGMEEKWEQVYERAQCVADSLRLQYGAEPAARVALVTHGTFGSFLLNAFLGLPLERGIRFSLYNAAFSLLEIEPDFLRLRYVNRIDHLLPDKIS